MDNLRAITAPMQRVPMLPLPLGEVAASAGEGFSRSASHSHFSSRFPPPHQQPEYSIAQPYIEGRRMIPTDTCDLSPKALAKAREHYAASECYLCPDCENTHGPGQCPLLAHSAPRTAHNANPPAWAQYLITFALGAAVSWIVVGLLF